MKKLILVIMVASLLITLSACGKVKENVENLTLDVAEEVDKVKDVIEEQAGNLTDVLGSKDVIQLDKNLKDRALLESIEYRYDTMEGKGYEIIATNYYSYEVSETETTMIYFEEQVLYQYTDEDGTSHFSLFLEDGTGYVWDDATKMGYLYPAELYEGVDDYDDYNEFDMDDHDFSQYYDTLIEAYVTTYNGFECLYMVLDEYGSETHIWIDLKTGMDIRHETYYNGNLEMYYEVTSLKVLDREPSGIFTPPTDVVFEEFSWDFDMDFDMDFDRDYDMDDFDRDDFDMEALLQLLEDAGIEVEPGMSLEDILELIDAIDY